MSKKIREITIKMLFVLKALCKFKVRVFLAYLVCISMIGLAPVLQLVILQKILLLLNQYTQRDVFAEGLLLIGAEGILFAFLTVLDKLKNLMDRIIALNISFNLDNCVIEKMKEVDLAAFDDPKFLNLHENATQKSDYSVIEAVSFCNLLISTTISIAGYITVVSKFNFVIVIIILVTLIPSILFELYYKKKQYDFNVNESTYRRKKKYYLLILTSLEYFKERKTYSYQNYFSDKKKIEFHEFFKKDYKLNLKECVGTLWMKFIGRIGSTICLVWIFVSIINGKHNVAQYAPLYYAIIALESSLESVFSIFSSCYESLLYFDLFYQFMMFVPSVGSGRENVAYGVVHKIEFQNVWFRYPGREGYVLKNISFEINTPMTVVFVGQNGSGKSTIIKLLLRFYDVTKGYILIDGKNIKEYDTAALNKLYSVIFQDFNKYAAKLSENITLSDVENMHNIESMTSAAEQGMVSEFANELSDTYETELTKMFSEKAIDLSVGQWQRVAISRALFSNKDILIFDEPTAALDTIAESYIYKTIGRLNKKNRIVIYISHMMYSTAYADKIIVLKDGEMHGIGKHSELIKTDEEYMKLYHAYLDSYVCELNKE